MSGEFRDRIAEVIFVRDRFDGPPQVAADAILAMPEMKAVAQLIDVVTRWAAMTAHSRDLLNEFRSIQETLALIYSDVTKAGDRG